MSTAAGRLAKPKLRGILLNRLKYHIPLAFALALTTQITLKIFFYDRRREKEAEFFRTYDAEKEFVRLKRIGAFDNLKKQFETERVKDYHVPF